MSGGRSDPAAVPLYSAFKNATSAARSFGDCATELPVMKRGGSLGTRAARSRPYGVTLPK